jgi:hypothetical protein
MVAALSELTDQVRRPSLESLEETARRRSQRAATVFAGATLVVLLAVAGAVVSGLSHHAAPPVHLPNDPNQTVVNADYGLSPVVRRSR